MADNRLSTFGHVRCWKIYFQTTLQSSCQLLISVTFFSFYWETQPFPNFSYPCSFLMLRLRPGVLNTACAAQLQCVMACKVFLLFIFFCPLYGCNTRLPEVFTSSQGSAGLLWGSPCSLYQLSQYVYDLQCHHTALSALFVVLISKTVWPILLQCIAGRFIES